MAGKQTKAFVDTPEAQMQSFDATGQYQHVTGSVLLRCLHLAQQQG